MLLLQKSSRYVGIAIACLLGPVTSFSQEVSKDEYHVFNPTPPQHMRKFVADRPDKTEGPFTVDAGHIQIEVDLVNVSINKDGTETTTERVFGNVNLKLGLTHNTDLQLVHEAFIDQKVEGAGPTSEEKGSGDTLLRFKWNIFGNDSGDIALAMMPFVKFPTGNKALRNDQTEYGLIIPVGLSLANDYSMGWMVQLNREKNQADNKLHTTYIASVTLGKGLTDSVGMYGELFQEMADEEGSAVIVTFDVGFTYALRENLQLDLGANFGVTSAADDFNPFLGVSTRF